MYSFVASFIFSGSLILLLEEMSLIPLEGLDILLPLPFSVKEGLLPCLLVFPD